MSKSVVITEGNISAQFGDVKRVAIKTSGGTEALLVPESEVNLKTLHINKNGTYKAKNQSCYGFSQVTVSGAGTESFTAGDDDHLGGIDLTPGEDYGLDIDQTGRLKPKPLPTKIEIIRQPNRNMYQVGDTIDPAGMIVGAYMKNGDLWKDETHPEGFIPYRELSFDPDKITAMSEGEYYTDGDGLNVLKLKLAGPIEVPFAGEELVIGMPAFGTHENRDHWYMFYQHTVYSDVQTPRDIYLTRDPERGIICAVAPELLVEWDSISAFEVTWANGDYHNDTNFFGTVGRDRWEQFKYPSFLEGLNIPVSEKNVYHQAFNESNLEKLLNSVTVKWKRPRDRKELTTELKIMVKAQTVQEDFEGGGGGHSF